MLSFELVKLDVPSRCKLIYGLSTTTVLAILSLILFLVSLLVFPEATFSYKIDASCARKGVENNVRDAMASAFSMADSAIQRLEQNPYDRETEDLIRNLFMPKDGQDPMDRDAISKVKMIFENINAYYRLESRGDVDNKYIVCCLHILHYIMY